MVECRKRQLFHEGQFNIIHKAQDLFENLFWEIHTDLIFELREKDSGKPHFAPEDIEALYRRVEAYIETMPENKELCQNYLEQCIKKVINDPYM